MADEKTANEPIRVVYRDRLGRTQIQEPVRRQTEVEYAGIGAKAKIDDHVVSFDAPNAAPKLRPGATATLTGKRSR
jgi:hypothetical protein